MLASLNPAPARAFHLSQSPRAKLHGFLVVALHTFAVARVGIDKDFLHLIVDFGNQLVLRVSLSPDRATLPQLASKLLEEWMIATPHGRPAWAGSKRYKTTPRAFHLDSSAHPARLIAVKPESLRSRQWSLITASNLSEPCAAGTGILADP